jgi:phytoene desaturase
MGHVVVIGAGIGGLAAAIELRLRGHSVEIHEQRSTPGGRANQLQLGEYLFDTGPSLLNYPWVFEQLFAAADRKLGDYLSLVAVDPSVSFAWPDGTRLTLSSSLDLLATELDRIEPGCRPALMAWLRDAECKYRLSFDRLISRNEDNPFRWLASCGLSGIMSLSLHRNMYSEIARHFKSRHIREALASYGMYLGGSPFELPGLFSILPYGELAYGLWLPKGGMFGLARSLAALAMELGVTLHLDSQAESVIIERQRATGIRLRTGDAVCADAVLSNCDLPRTILSLLPDEPATRALRIRSHQLRMTPGVVTFYWGVKCELPGLSHHTIFLPHDYSRSFGELSREQRLPDDLPFYVSVASRTDPSLAPHGSHGVFVLVPTPVLSQMPGANWQSTVAHIREKVLSRLQSEGVELSLNSIEQEAFWTPVEWRDNFGLHDGSAFGAAHGLLEVGPFRMRNYAPELPGMYFVGASTTPGTGVPLVTLGGRLAAERISQHVH